MIELIILGSSGSIPIRERNLPSIALKYRSEILLFDCGEDVQRRFLEAGLKLNKPMKIFITHFHGDHIIGLPGLLFRFNLTDRTAPLAIYGPPRLFIYLYFHHKIVGLKARYPLRIIEIDHDTNTLIKYDGLNNYDSKTEIKIENNTLFESKYYSIQYAVMEHSVRNYAYSFIEKPRPGKFHPEKAKELGIPPSPLWKKMQEGKKITYKGKRINPINEGIVDPKRSGRKITYSGDTAPCNALIELGKNSDILIHEATYTEHLKNIARKKKHSTSVDAAEIALKMNAKQLLLTHISSRYEDDTTKLLEEAKNVFPNTLLARDLMKISLF
ncbi:MAG: ribonuclease Z [Promethearchaeota archaeon]